MRKLMLGLLLASATVANAAPGQSRSGKSAVTSLYGHWRIVGVTVPRDGVQALGTDDPGYMGQRLTFTPRRLSWDRPNPSYGGSPCVGPVIRSTRLPLEPDERIAKFRNRIMRAFAVGCTRGAWGPAAPPAATIMTLHDGTITLSWFDGALLRLKRVV